jgi:hypothetical protein
MITLSHNTGGLLPRALELDALREEGIDRVEFPCHFQVAR